MLQEIVTVFESLSQMLCVAFNAPTANNFLTLSYGLVLCLGRPTVRNMLRASHRKVTKHESSYHRFFARARWSVDQLSKVLLLEVLIPLFAPTGDLHFAGDDTTCGKSGRRVAFASWYRDAVHSSGKHQVIHWGHNWVMLCLIVPCPFAAQRKLHVPVMARLYRSEKSCQGGQRPFKTRHELLSQMMEKLCQWLPERSIRLSADGAYAAEKMLSSLPSQVAFTSRVRRDAAIYELAPERTKKRGRPREKGARLPSLKAIGEKALCTLGQVTRYGVTEEVLMHTFVCLWPTVSKKKPIRIVIVRDQKGKEPDDYFFTTDLDTSVVAVTEEYAGRWGIEEAIRELKQSLGMDEVQSWSAPCVWRQVPFVLIMHSLVVAAYYKAMGATVTAGFVPPSFGQMLTRLRFGLWEERIKEALAFEQSESKIMADLHAILQTAA